MGGRLNARRAWRVARSILFWLHLGTALVTGGVIMLLALTGLGLAFQRTVLARAASAHRVSPAGAAAPRLPLDSLARIVRHATGAELAGVTVSADPSLPLTFSLRDRRSVFVDPSTGRLLGNDDGARRVFQFIERVHRSLAIGAGMRSPVGTAVVGVANFAFCFLLVSGLILWWPRQWTRRAFRAVLVPQGGKAGRSRDWSWHHAVGFWAAPFIFLVAVTGVFMSYAWPQRLVVAAVGAQANGERAEGRERQAREGRERQAREGRERQAREERERQAREERERQAREGARSQGGRDRSRGRLDEGRTPDVPANLDRLIVTARSVSAEETVQLRLPTGESRTATATIAPARSTRPDTRVQLTLDPSSGRLIREQRYADLDAARRFRAWVRPLHTGEAGGLAGQGFAALVCALILLLGYTGFSLSLVRFRARARTRRAELIAQSTIGPADASATPFVD